MEMRVARRGLNVDSSIHDGIAAKDVPGATIPPSEIAAPPINVHIAEAKLELTFREMMQLPTMRST